jgi:hypothetical protein
MTELFLLVFDVGTTHIRTVFDVSKSDYVSRIAFVADITSTTVLAGIPKKVVGGKQRTGCC